MDKTWMKNKAVIAGIGLLAFIAMVGSASAAVNETVSEDVTWLFSLFTANLGFLSVWPISLIVSAFVVTFVIGIVVGLFRRRKRR